MTSHKAARKHIAELKAKAQEYAEISVEHGSLCAYYLHLHEETQNAIATLEEAFA